MYDHGAATAAYQPFLSGALPNADFNDIVARSAMGGGSKQRPASFKAIGISLAISSGCLIGVSFVLKKVGLLKANEKYNEVAGEGYGYLKNFYWWAGMTLMILGEICNFVAYAFTDALLVTPLGALSVVITTVLSAIFLKERLSVVGKVACFLCIVGSVVIVLHAPETSSVGNIQQMQQYAISPGFLTYAGIIIVGSVITAWYAGPRWGNKNMLVYISICSWVGGLSVVSTQGLGASIIAWIGGEPEYKHWFLWVLLVFVVCTLLAEIIYLNKALNLFNAAMVTPTYYVYFTSTTIITSAVLFRGFKAPGRDLATIVMGFLVICSGVVLLQLSKSAKDVPDAAVFRGDLDQIQTIAEQEQPETEPKADAIRGTAAIVRKISQARQRMEERELARLREEKSMDTLQPIEENGQPQYEWDGLRRRKTLVSSTRTRSVTSPGPAPFTPPPPSPHPPLGMSAFPTDQDVEEQERPSTMFSSIVGTIRARSRTNATMPPSYGDEESGRPRSPGIRPVPLTEIVLPKDNNDDEAGSYYGASREHVFPRDTAYRGASAGSGTSLAPPTPPPHSARRQFSFQRVFRKTPDTTEEERLGLVKELDGTRSGEEENDYKDDDPQKKGFV
ncbi:Magnesium transporter NIPA2 [Beauveria bassiana]|nr:Magnesium transporter NIPA2 [Beauveria bassiana]KAH8720968.1 Magnesium transporter NIPA2 [Beauveria bassiana]